MTEPDPYDQFFAETVAEWNGTTAEDAEYRLFYPETTNPKENHR